MPAGLEHVDKGDVLPQPISTEDSETDVEVCSTTADRHSLPANEEQETSGYTSNHLGYSRPSSALESIVSIIIDAVDDESQSGDEDDCQSDRYMSELAEKRMRSRIDAAIKVKRIIAYAKTRQDEFARLLQEHAEIVSQINKYESVLS